MKLWLGVLYILLLLSLTFCKSSSKPATRKPKKNHKTKSRSAPFIVGGSPLFDIFDAEFVVGLVRLYKNYHEYLCPAAIILPHFAVTVDGCTKKMLPGEIRAGHVVLRGGTSYIQGSGGFDHKIYKVYDLEIVALIRVKNGFYNYPYEKPIRLIASSSYVYGPYRAEVFGWGESFYEGTGSETLKLAEVLLINNKKCNEYYPNINENTTDLVCATNVTGVPCTGDVGGPLVRDNVLIGILSYTPCGYDNTGIYVRIPAFTSAIEEIVGKGKLEYSPPCPKLN